jgi:hypothetical protein
MRMNPIRTALVASLCAPLAAVAAEPVNFGSWQVGITDDRDSIYAGTINDSGSVLAESCATDRDSCIWVLSTDSECEEGSDYPVLINSDVSAASAVVTCLGPTVSNTMYRYQFTNWKVLEGTILKARRVGFAFPLQADQFTVVRFSLDGVSQASQFAERLAAEARKATSDSTRNTRL